MEEVEGEQMGGEGQGMKEERDKKGKKGGHTMTLTMYNPSLGLPTSTIISSTGMLS